MPITSDYCYHYLSIPYSTIWTMALHLSAFEQPMRNDLMHTGTHTHIWKICRQLWEITRKSWTGVRWELLLGWSPAEFLCGLSCSPVATVICTWPLLEKQANITHLCPLSPLFCTPHSVHHALSTAQGRLEWTTLSWSSIPMPSPPQECQLQSAGFDSTILFFCQRPKNFRKLYYLVSSFLPLRTLELK